MNDLRVQLDDYLGEPPRTTVDVDDLVRRGRRSARSRRLGSLAGVVALCALATTGLLVLRQGPPSPADDPDRLLAAVKAVLTRVAPQVTNLDSLQRKMARCTVDAQGRVTAVEFVPYDAARVSRECQHPGWAGDGALHWTGQLWRTGTVSNVRISIGRTAALDPRVTVPEQSGAFRPFWSPQWSTRAELAIAHGPSQVSGPSGEWLLTDGRRLLVERPDGTGVLLDLEEPYELFLNGYFPVYEKDDLLSIGLDPALRP
ncbi:hypothetical protein CS0771_08400 [Catellatospora sp. IY07-71]|uniref:hypothetical protein n=1 Tax=Catellatospora sp. IY07-71 TaxID=2728827 RepID=UPI001BB380C7|nr:hypothetical protein [Catellatospora sp. IY07-71]BCJ71296.1 hypothetical protein CS0771_08400 [Catellatospora sp. IY07-71]